MGRSSKISWTDATFNPGRGCRRVSPGCENCYAERMSGRYSGPGLAFEGMAKSTPSGPRWTGTELMPEHMIEKPLHWKKPLKVFVNSMSDLYYSEFPFDWVDKVFATMMKAKWHTFQILTKRPE